MGNRGGNTGRIISYKGMRVNILGLPAFSDFNDSCDEDEEIFKRKRSYLPSFNSPLGDTNTKDLLVLYDIPEGQKRERDWFRRHLVKFGFIMIQRSAWIGPSPLPKNFLDYLKEIKIENNFKTFKLATPYSGGTNN